MVDFFRLSFFDLCSGTPNADFRFSFFLEDVGVAPFVPAIVFIVSGL